MNLLSSERMTITSRYMRDIIWSLNFKSKVIINNFAVLRNVAASILQHPAATGRPRLF